MQPYTGDVYALREQLLGDAEVGDRIDVDAVRARMREIFDATKDERQAAEQKELVRVSEQAAQRLKLGAREQRRRRRRRKG